MAEGAQLEDCCNGLGKISLEPAWGGGTRNAKKTDLRDMEEVEMTGLGRQDVGGERGEIQDSSEVLTLDDSG